MSTMSVLTILQGLVFSDIIKTIITLLVGYVVYKLSKFYYMVYTLPPGPFPLPIIGNLLIFRRSKRHWFFELRKLSRKYGPVMTFWFGRDPMIMISDIDVLREAFRKNDFAGRPYVANFSDILTAGNYTDILVADYGHEWEALRRVAHSAAQKYAGTDKLINVAIDCVDYTIDTIIENEGEKPFLPFDYFYNMFLNIFAASAFGKRFNFEDEDWKSIKYVQKDLFIEADKDQEIVDLLPILKYFMGKKIDRFRKLFYEVMTMIKEKYQAHYKDYDENVIRDFCDTLITAKNEAIKENKESAPYLTDGNLGLVIGDLFLAGTDNSSTSLSWQVLYMTQNDGVEDKLREEIDNVIGDRMPTHEDRNRCHYCMAFISEVMRIRQVVPGGIPHKAVVTSKIGEYTIPQGTQVLSFIGDIQTQERYWPNADQFKPERFLENDKYLTSRPKAFIPFGVGRRVCIGERLAIADLFLVLARFLQRTSQYKIVVNFEHDDDKFEPDANNQAELHPKKYTISLRKR